MRSICNDVYITISLRLRFGTEKNDKGISRKYINKRRKRCHVMKLALVAFHDAVIGTSSEVRIVA